MRTLLDLFQTFKNKKNTAIIYTMPGQRSEFSYAEIYDHSLRLAAWLKQQGVGKGDRVALWMQSSPLTVVCFFAVLARGATVVPITVGLKIDEAKARINFSRCKLVISQGGKNPAGKDRLTVLAGQLPQIIETSKPIAAVKVRPGDLAEILYTSGTGGAAKGAMHSHKNLVTNVEMRAKALPHPVSGESSLCLIDFSHGFGQTAGFLVPFLLGGTVVFAADKKNIDIPKLWLERRLSAIMLAPFSLRGLKDCLEKIQPGATAVLTKKLAENFKFFVCVGTALDSQTLAFWEKLNMPVLQGYGMTECFPISMNNLGSRREGTVGKLAIGMRIRFREGEIQLLGDNIFKGYWNNPAATKAAFTKDGWFKTGDLGELTNDGFVKLFGRREEAIELKGGRKVFPATIEHAVNSIKGVRESCVLLKHGRLCAVLVVENKKTDLSLIMSQANKKLPEFSRLQSVVLSPAPELPKTHTGKIQRFRVAEWVNDYLP